MYWAQLSRFHLKAETESSLRNVVFYIKDRTMNNVQNSDKLVMNIPQNQMYLVSDTKC
jgi:hypothetical protein